MLICQKENICCLQLETINSSNMKKYDCRLTILNSPFKYGISEMVTNLIESDCNHDTQNKDQHNQFIPATRNDYILKIEDLLKTTDIYFSNSNGVTILELVCQTCISYLTRSSRTLQAQVILEKFFEKVSNDFWTDKDKVKQFLLNANNMVQIFAIVFSRIELTWFLLANGFAVNQNTFFYKQSAIYYAIICAKLDKAKILIKHGANVNERDYAECTPLYYYVDLCQYYDEKSELLIMLLSCTDNLAGKDSLNTSPLEHLLQFGNRQTVETLLQNVTGIATMKFQFDKSLLHVLIENENIEDLDLLEELNMPFDVNARRSDKKTCLMAAIDLTSVKKVEFLLEHNADVNLTIDKGSEFEFHGESALRIAIILHEDYCKKFSELSKDAAKIIILLLQHGANEGGTDMKMIYFLDNFYHKYKNGLSVDIFIAHVALLKIVDPSDLIDFICSMFREFDEFEAGFRSCNEQIEEMKNAKVLKTLTLFEILIENPEKMANWVRNPEFLKAFNEKMEKSFHLNLYYLDILHSQLAKALYMENQKAEAVSIIEEMTGFDAHAYHMVMSNIIRYLDNKDLKNLLRIKTVHCVPKMQCLVRPKLIESVSNRKTALDLMTFFAHTVCIFPQVFIFAKKLTSPLMDINIFDLAFVLTSTFVSVVV